MVIGSADARDELQRRLEAVFSSEAFPDLYPGAKQPRVYFGFPATEPPYYVAVDVAPDSAEAVGAVSMGHMQVDFTIYVWLCAQHTDYRTAADTLQAYEDAVFASIMADPQLRKTVDNAFPSIEATGTSADSSKRYIAAARLGIRCTRWSACPAEIEEIVRAANEEGGDESQSG